MRDLLDLDFDDNEALLNVRDGSGNELCTFVDDEACTGLLLLDAPFPLAGAEDGAGEVADDFNDCEDDDNDDEDGDGEEEDDGEGEVAEGEEVGAIIFVQIKSLSTLFDSASSEPFTQ